MTDEQAMELAVLRYLDRDRLRLEILVDGETCTVHLSKHGGVAACVEVKGLGGTFAAVYVAILDKLKADHERAEEVRAEIEEEIRLLRFERGGNGS